MASEESTTEANEAQGTTTAEARGSSAPSPNETTGSAAPTPEVAPAATASTEAKPAEAEAKPAETEAKPAEAEAKPAETEAKPAETASEKPGGSPKEAAPSATTDGEPQAAAGESAGEEGKKKKRRRRRKKKKPGDGNPATKHTPERSPFNVGEEVFGKVTAVLETAIMIDLSGKALAIFDRGEMEPDDLVPGVGDRFVASIHNDGARGGLVVLSRKPLREEATKPLIEAAAGKNELVEGLVTGVIKGGIEVDLDGLRAFAPASGMDLHPGRANFVGLLGQRLKFKVVQFDNKGRDVVVTRRPMLEAEAHQRRKGALETLTPGQELKGIVRTIVEWGAFVALPEAENLEGLVHVSEASHDARNKMEDLFQQGQEIKVKITKIDEKGKIWLSHKALLADPWAEAKKKFPSGTRHKGKITKLVDFGAFVELEPGIEGLMHVADMSLTRIDHPSDLVKEGEEIEVIVFNFDKRHRKLALHPAPTGDRAEEKFQKISRGAELQVEVVKAEGPGVVVRVLGVTGRGARGFMPAGHTNTERGSDLRKSFPVGKRLDVKVIDIDPRRGEPKLSIRAKLEDEERKAHRDYRKKVAAEAKFGTLGDLLAKAGHKS